MSEGIHNPVTPFRLLLLCGWIALILAVLILLGAAILQQPWALVPGITISRFDALFLAVSGVCGVGLSVVEPSSILSPFGWGVIAVLIEVGFFCLLILGAAIVEELNIQFPSQDSVQRHSLGAICRGVIAFTLAIQLLGAIAMMPWWGEGTSTAERVGLSLFHAISAASHAGFSPLPTSLQAYRYSPLAHLVIVPLIVVTGLGYPVVSNLWLALRSRSTAKLTPFTKLAVAMTAGLYLYGVVTLTGSALATYFYERLQLGTTSNMPVPGPLTWDRAGAAIADASFLAVSSRSAGLTTMPTEEITPAGRFVVMTLMFVGTTPGGAGGGVFGITLGVWFIAAWRAIQREKDEDSKDIVNQALSIAASVVFFFGALVAVGIFLLSLFEPYPFIKLAFEVTSAAGSSGLSLGITGILTRFSRAVLIGLMFAGRVGPLVVLAMSLRAHGDSQGALRAAH